MLPLQGENHLIQKDIEELIYFLAKDSELIIHIETNGSVPIYNFKRIDNLDNVSFILDYKLPSSGMENKMDMKNYEVISKKDVCKFVIETMEDLIKAKEIVETF